MMTRKSFIERQQAATRESSRVNLFWMIIFFGVIIGNALWATSPGNHKSQAWMNTVYTPLFIGFVLLQLPLMIWYSKRCTRKFGLLCPSCGKPLTGSTAQIAIATGNCGHCGSSILNADE